MRGRTNLMLENLTRLKKSLRLDILDSWPAVSEDLGLDSDAPLACVLLEMTHISIFQKNLLEMNDMKVSRLSTALQGFDSSK